MALDAMTQQALSNDARFRQRVKNALVTVAWQQLGSATPGSTAYLYAQNAIRNADAIAGQVAQWLVARPNVSQSSVTFDTTTGAVVMILAATDADLQSQISTDWNKIAS